MNILITGGNGYIAKSLSRKIKNCDICLASKKDLDLTVSDSVNSFFKDKYFDVVLHTAISGGKRGIEEKTSNLYENCSMHFNILRNQKKFGKYISFGSGAEFDRELDIDNFTDTKERYPIDYYGMSKKIIALTGETVDKFYNIRIFAVFNEHENSTRMIKQNILKYINKESIIIHQDKYMDFFYMDDLVSVVEYFINHTYHAKEINCVYKEKYKLSDIAKLINNLDNYRVNINIENKEMGKSYIGKYDMQAMPIRTFGLETGIKAMYDKIKGVNDEKFIS